MIKEIGDVAFELEVAGNEKPVLLLIYAPWCGDCRRIMPVMNDCSELPEFENVCFRQMDVDKNPETKKNLNVERYPTLFLFKNGRKVAERTAEVPSEEQKAIIQSILGGC